MHHFGSPAERRFATPAGYDAQSRGYRQAVLVGAAHGAVHSHVTVNELAPGGDIAVHMHSFEEGAYLLDGEAIVVLGDEALHLRPGDFLAAKAGMLHGWRAIGSTTARWLQIATPQPRPAGMPRDTFFARSRRVPEHGTLLAGGTPALAGHFDAAQIPPPGTPRPGLATLPGVFLQWLIDEAFGARHHRMLFIEYQPTVGIGAHDHTFEETYFILTGEIEAVLDGQTYIARPGDVIWTAVGCEHSFTNRSATPVRWLETFAPQPPDENVFRFAAEWDARGKAVEES
jgi:quercetin dioxygenase-like cupin family protein